jgi:hypothetical protein
VEALGLLAGREVTEMESNGPFALHSDELAWLELGGRRAEHVPADFRLPGPGPLDSRTTVGVLGAEFLGATRVVFDYGRERFALVPRSK